MEIFFCDYDLGENIENMQLIAEGLKTLPINLQYFKLDLNHCTLGINWQNIKYLAEAIK